MKRFFKNGEEPLDHHFGLDMPENAGTYPDCRRGARCKVCRLGLEPSGAAHVLCAAGAECRLQRCVDEEAGIAFALHGRNDAGDQRFHGRLEPLLTRALAEVDPNLTISRVRTMQQQIYFSFNQERAVASLAGLFGIVALLLAAIGLYGVTAYTVAQRTQEIGIRMALGADRVKVVQLVLAGASRRVGIGLLLGVPLAIGAGRLIATQLYGVSSWDPMALGIAAVALAISAFFAAVIPARRAASISPMKAFRTE